MQHEIVCKIEITDSLDIPLHCEVLVGHQKLDESEIVEFLKPEKSMRDHILPDSRRNLSRYSIRKY